MVNYSEQERGERSDYDRYLAGMDASMRQKVALTAAHLLCTGDLADMGMGSGAGSFALASLYPELDVVGVDVNPAMVAIAADKYQLPNLRFIDGDIAQPCLETGAYEAVLNSSVLHHVTSFGGYSYAAAKRALAVQLEAIAPGGVLVVRDFVAPEPGPVWLELPADDHRSPSAEALKGVDDDVAWLLSCSTAELFIRFASEFRSLGPTLGFSWKELEPCDDGWRRFACDHRHAVEFVLRKDYRRDWVAEVQEEYTYWTQREFEEVFAGLGLRTLASTPLHNPWILDNRFVGQFRLRQPDGELLPWPATNFVIVGQRVPSVAGGTGVRMVESAVCAPLQYLKPAHYRRTSDGVVFDLIRRPGLTIDVVPHFESDGALFILARRSYPRPILAAKPRGSATLTGAARVGYASEPLNVQRGDRPIGETVERLLARVGIRHERIHSFSDGATYYPSPGGLQEEVRSVFVEIAKTSVLDQPKNYTGFSSAGVVRALETRQLLRAAQVGGLPDARLELNVYELLARHHRGVGAWIGATLQLHEVPLAPSLVQSTEQLSARPPRRRFEPATVQSSNGFMAIHAARFDEHDRHGAVVGSKELEFVVPSTMSTNTISLLPLLRHDTHVYVGLEDDDLPAAQCFVGNSQLLTVPAWRLPHAVTTWRAAVSWARERLAVEHGVRCLDVTPLGGHYHPSAGATPEVVYPAAAAVTRVDGLVSGGNSVVRPLIWTRLDKLTGVSSLIRDGHLRVAVWRAAHMLDLLQS